MSSDDVCDEVERGMKKEKKVTEVRKNQRLCKAAVCAKHTLSFTWLVMKLLGSAVIEELNSMSVCCLASDIVCTVQHEMSQSIRLSVSIILFAIL